MQYYFYYIIRTNYRIIKSFHFVYIYIYKFGTNHIGFYVYIGVEISVAFFFQYKRSPSCQVLHTLYSIVGRCKKKDMVRHVTRKETKNLN